MLLFPDLEIGQIIATEKNTIFVPGDFCIPYYCPRVPVMIMAGDRMPFYSGNFPVGITWLCLTSLHRWVCYYMQL